MTPSPDAMPDSVWREEEAEERREEREDRAEEAEALLSEELRGVVVAVAAAPAAAEVRVDMVGGVATEMLEMLLGVRRRCHESKVEDEDEGDE